MLVIFQGGESADHVATLTSVCELFDAPIPLTMCVSYKGLQARKKSPEYISTIATHVNVVMEGGYSTASLDLPMAEALEKDYYSYAFAAPELVFAVQFDHPSLGVRPISDPRVVPLVPGDDIKSLRSMLELAGSVAMPLTSDPRVKSLLLRNPTSLSLALGTSDLHAAHKAGFNVVMTSAWYAPGRFGEISLWDGGQLLRRNSHERDDLLKRHGGYLSSQGFDMDLLNAGDSRSLNRLAAWSYIRWAESFPDSFEEIPDSSAQAETKTAAPEESAPQSITVRSETRSVQMGRVSRLIPGFSHEQFPTDEPGSGEVVGYEPRNLLASSGDSLRKCDTCFIAANCPSFDKGARCAYNFPVEVRTPAQVKAMLSTMVELQAGRVAFAKFAEDVNGGYPDETVGLEMDRLFKMADQLTRPTKKERLTVSVESETHGGGTGVLSAIFGQRPAEKLPPTEPVRIIEQAEPHKSGDKS